MKYFASQSAVSYHPHSTNNKSPNGFAANAKTAIGPTGTVIISDLAQKDPRKSQLEFNKLRKRLRRQMGKAIADYTLIEQGDRVMVCISGGKDSHVMLELLIALRESAPIDFDIVAVTLDQKQPDYPEEVLPAYLETLGIPFYILERDTYSVVKSVIPEVKQPVVFVLVCVGARSTVSQRRLVRPRSRSAIIAMILLRHYSSICFSVEN